MSNEPKVISFKDAHDKKHGPDAAHVYVDGMGVKWFEFTCSYKDGDKEFGFTLWATDFADAERRMVCLRETGRIDGQLHTTVPG
jgi:hypothetical protein